MNDPCNLARNQQRAFVPGLIAAPCAPTYATAATTIASDWNDIGAVVDYLRTLRHVDRVNLVAWSLGGPRAGGYAAQHPDRCSDWCCSRQGTGAPSRTPRRLRCPSARR